MFHIWQTIPLICVLIIRRVNTAMSVARTQQAMADFHWLCITCSFSFNPHLPNELSHPYKADESIFHLRGVWCTFFHFFFHIFDRNSCEQTV